MRDFPSTRAFIQDFPRQAVRPTGKFRSNDRTPPLTLSAVASDCDSRPPNAVASETNRKSGRTWRLMPVQGGSFLNALCEIRGELRHSRSSWNLAAAQRELACMGSAISYECDQQP